MLQGGQLDTLQDPDPPEPEPELPELPPAELPADPLLPPDPGATQRSPSLTYPELQVSVHAPSAQADVAFHSAGHAVQSVREQPTVGPGSTQLPLQRFCVAEHAVLPLPPEPVPPALAPEPAPALPLAAPPTGEDPKTPPKPPLPPLLPLLPPSPPTPPKLSRVPPSRSLVPVSGPVSTATAHATQRPRLATNPSSGLRPSILTL
jgi:hypothetical protein